MLGESKGLVLVEINKAAAGALCEVELKFRREDFALKDVGELLVAEGFALWEEGWKSLQCPFGQQAGTERSSDASSGDIMRTFLVEEMEEQLVGVQDDFSYFMAARVILTGNLGPRVTELNFTSWAEQSWGKVDSFIFGYNQVVITFSAKESAEMCLRQGNWKFEGIVLEAFPISLSLTNGIYVQGLVLNLRKTDVEKIFCKFGEIAFTKGPFGSPRPEVENSAVVVFKHKEGMERALKCSDIKFGGKRLFVKRNADSKRHQKQIECISQIEVSSKVTDEKAREVEVLHIVSPHQIYVRFSSDCDRWSRFYQELQEAGEKEAACFDKLKMVIGEKVLCGVESVWHRGTLVNIGMVCLVKLVDLGVKVKVDIENIRKLEDIRIIKENVFAKVVSLTGIEAAGSGGWSDSSVDLLYNITKKKKLMHLKKDSGQEDLIVEEMTACNPLDVESVVRTSLTDILLEEGLALRKDIRIKCARKWNGSKEKSKTPGTDSFVETNNTFLLRKIC